MIILFCRQNSSNEVQVALMLKKKKGKTTQPDILIKISQCAYKPLSWSYMWGVLPGGWTCIQRPL